MKYRSIVQIKNGFLGEDQDKKPCLLDEEGEFMLYVSPLLLKSTDPATCSAILDDLIVQHTVECDEIRRRAYRDGQQQAQREIHKVLGIDRIATALESIEGAIRHH